MTDDLSDEEDPRGGGGVGMDDEGDDLEEDMNPRRRGGGDRQRGDARGRPGQANGQRKQPAPYDDDDGDF